MLVLESLVVRNLVDWLSLWHVLLLISRDDLNQVRVDLREIATKGVNQYTALLQNAIYPLLFRFKLSYLILIIYTQLYGFKYFYLILIIYT